MKKRSIELSEFLIDESGSFSDTDEQQPLLESKGSDSIVSDTEFNTIEIDSEDELERDGQRRLLLKSKDLDENGSCELIITNKHPRELLKNIKTDAAYIRSKDSLYYYRSDYRKKISHLSEVPWDKKFKALFDIVKDSLSYNRKKTGQLFKVPLDNKFKALFDIAFKVQDVLNDGKTKSELLTKQQLNHILFLTGNLSAWQKKNGALLLTVYTPPEEEVDLNTLPITSAAYIRYNNELWYFKKHNWLEKRFHNWLEKRFMAKNWLVKRFMPEPELRKLQVTREKLEIFDRVMKTTAAPYQSLSDSGLSKIEKLVGHSHKTFLQKTLANFGYFCSAFFALGCGVSTAGTFISLGLVTGGLAWACAGALFLAGTLVNWWIFKRYVPKVLIDLFGKEKIFVDVEGKPLSGLKKFAIGIALALSLSVGITFAALTYTNTFTLSVALPFLAVIAPAFPYIAVGLFAVTLVSMTALMFMDIRQLIQKKDVWGECKKFLKNMVSLDPELPQNKGKTRRRILAERIATVVLTALFLPLACFGLYMTMNACAPGVKAILLEKIPSTSIKVAEIVANVISLGLAFAGQIPFGIQTALQTVKKIVQAASQWVANASPSRWATNASQWVTNLFSKNKHAEEQLIVEKKSFIKRAAKLFNVTKLIVTKLINITKLPDVCANAIGNGLISMKGAAGPVWFRVIALLGGTGNSAFAGIPAVLGSEEEDFAKTPKLPGKNQIRETDEPRFKKHEGIIPCDTSPLKPITLNISSTLFNPQNGGRAALLELEEKEVDIDQEKQADQKLRRLFETTPSGSPQGERSRKGSMDDNGFSYGMAPRRR